VARVGGHPSSGTATLIARNIHTCVRTDLLAGIIVDHHELCTIPFGYIGAVGSEHRVILHLSCLHVTSSCNSHPRCQYTRAHIVVHARTATCSSVCAWSCACVRAMRVVHCCTRGCNHRMRPAIMSTSHGDVYVSRATLQHLYSYWVHGELYEVRDRSNLARTQSLNCEQLLFVNMCV
jgi:hypothetical protein